MSSQLGLRIGACFTAAALLEVSVYPSPGLVSPLDSGAHLDMNSSTFMLGTAMLAPHFTTFVELGQEYCQRPVRELFVALRKQGRRAERDLLRATSGINTQRGQLFVLGVAAGVAGWCLARKQRVPSEQFYSAVAESCTGLVSRELASRTPADACTTGQRAYLEEGVSGVRGEAEGGFPTVRQVGYPAFEEGLQRGLSLNDAAVHSLLAIMATLEDTTVWGRLGRAGVLTMRDTVQEILNFGSVFTAAGRESILRAHRYFSQSRISPGGAADLLALTMALYFIDHGLPTPDVLLSPSLFVRA